MGFPAATRTHHAMPCRAVKCCNQVRMRSRGKSGEGRAVELCRSVVNFVTIFCPFWVTINGSFRSPAPMVKFVVPICLAQEMPQMEFRRPEAESRAGSQTLEGNSAIICRTERERERKGERRICTADVDCARLTRSSLSLWGKTD